MDGRAWLDSLFAGIIQRDGGRVNDYRIYADVSPLFA